MCGRYVTVSSVKAIENRFNVHVPDNVSQAMKPNANVSHGEFAPIIASDEPEQVQQFQFGFTPRWAKKQFYTINARSEGDHNTANDSRYTGAMGILQKPMFRQSIRDRRCLIIADAFIEGPEREKLTKPYVVYPRSGERPMALAGIWDEWRDPSSGECIRSFAILTTVANELMQAIGHHRCPIVLKPESERAWVDLQTPLQDITSLMRPCENGRLNAYPISADIRDPRANGSHLLQPIGERIHSEWTYELHKELELFGMGESRSKSNRGNAQQGSLF